MFRTLLILLVGLCLFPSAVASSDAQAMPDVATLSKDCYTKVGPLLQSGGGRLTQEVRKAYLDWSEKTVLQALRQSNQVVSEDCLKEVRRDAASRDAIFGSVFPPDPSILQNYSQLRTQLGEKLLPKYRSLILAISVAKRIKGIEKVDESANIGRDYQPGFWVDESLRVPGSDAEKEYVRQIADFLKQSQNSALDVYQNPAIQDQLKVYLAQHGVPDGFVAEVRKWVPFGERLKYAMVLLGQRPAARETKPGTIAWLRHLVEIHEARPTSTPTIDGKPMPWPLFPLGTAPWPLLMPLAHPVPLSEANYIWAAFQGEYGSDRYHTYGPYRGDDDVMPDALKPSKWFWDAFPDQIVHGGMCVPISKATVELYSSLGKPAMWAGQPGHANLISFQFDGNTWTAEIEQAFAGGPDVTMGQWYFDEDPGTQPRCRDLYWWPGAEYHLGLALAMNVGLKSYMDTRLAANILRAMPAEDQKTVGVKLLRDVLLTNPFNPEIWYRLGELTPDPMQGLKLVVAASKGNAGLLSNPPDNLPLVMHGIGGASDQYWRTVTQFELYAALLSHPTPVKIEDMRRVYYYLKTIPTVNPNDLATYAERYLEHRPANPADDNAKYDMKLAEEGDAYGQLRMGQRYRDGDGVSQSDAKAMAFFSRAVSQGDATAGILLGNLNPTIPANLITVRASSVYGPDQAVTHLVDGSGMLGAAHDNEGASRTMWHTRSQPEPRPPARDLPPAPAWVRFDFAGPMKFDSILIWNHNQLRLTDRGFRKTRIYGSSDGVTWVPLTAPGGIVLPQASGEASSLPVILPNTAERSFRSVIIAADATGGNYGGDCYGLSAVRFVTHRLKQVIPAQAVTVTASSVFSAQQAVQHLIDGSGMFGGLHDNADAAQTMWHTTDRPAPQPPVQGLAPSPAWVRFDFAQAQQVDSILIWNHNQLKLTDRSFRKARIYVSADGTTWHLLNGRKTFELPRASGSPLAEPTTIPVSLDETIFKSVIIAAEAVDGNYGGSCYGLSAVRFVVQH